MQILHLATAHTPIDPRIAEKECRALLDAGHNVAFVVPHERGAHVADETLGGVRILGVSVPRDGKERLLRTTRAVVRRALAAAQPDAVLHVHEPELLPVVLPLAARGRRVVYDAHEDAPRQVFHQGWIPDAAKRPVSLGFAGLEALVARLGAGIVAATPTIAARFPAAKTALVRNFPVLDDAPVPPYGAREHLVAYVGAVTEARGAAEMVRASALLPDGARLTLAGPLFPPTLGARLDALPGADRTDRPGRIDRAAVTDLLARARVGLVVLHPTPQYVDAYPTKLFEYMAAGLPVVASDIPLWRRMVERAGCGFLVDPFDPAAIAEACTRLLTDEALAARMGASGRAEALARFAWQGEAARLVAFYAAIERGERPGQPQPEL